MYQSEKKLFLAFVLEKSYLKGSWLPGKNLLGPSACALQRWAASQLKNSLMLKGAADEALFRCSCPASQTQPATAVAPAESLHNQAHLVPPTIHYPSIHLHSGRWPLANATNSNSSSSSSTPLDGLHSPFSLCRR